MTKRLWMVSLVFILAMAGSAIARAHATLLLTSGERVTGELIDLGADFTISVNGSERHVPKGEVAVIDFSGDATNLAAAELARLDGSGQGVVLSSGEVLQGRLSDISGSQPLKLTFDLVSGGTRDFNSNEVKRVYLSRPSSASTSTANPPTTAGPSGAGIPVPANQSWVDTGITVRRGQRVSFSASGEVQLSSDTNDKASVVGSPSGRRPKGPMPQIPAGALIGRIGTGTPFGIGNQTIPLAMPGDGRLFLGVNDDFVQDNQGQFLVQVRPGALTNR